LILLAGALAHGLCLGADYYMDDGVNINAQFLAWDGGWTVVKWRWLPASLSAVTFQVFGESPMAQHVWNLAIHLLLSLTVFWGAHVFLEAGKVFADRAQVRRAAFFAGLVFACHPICSEAVNYARCTRIQWVSLFSVLAAIGTLRFCQRPNWRAGLGTVAVVVLATFSKDPGLLHAVGNVMIVAAVFANWGRLTSCLRRPIDWANSLLAVAAFFWIGLHGFTMWWVNRALRSFGGSGLNFGEHALTQGRVFWAYAQRVLVPVHLSVDHDIPMTRSLADWPAVVMTAGLVLLVIGVGWMMLLSRRKIVGVLAMLALAPLLLRFLYPISELMVEYRVYPAMPWIAMLAGIGLAILYRKNAQVTRFAVLFLVAGGVLGSAARSAVWQDAAVLAQDVLKQYPTNNRARNELQRLAYEAGDYETVFELRADVLAAVAEVDRYNAAHLAAGRAFNVHRTNGWYLSSEARVALALAESVGSKAALAHIDAVEQKARVLHPEYFDEKHESHKYILPLEDLREHIEKFGATRDRELEAQASTVDPNRP
jgi:hypothetical protein